jgi:hypothetical protein
MAPSTPDIARPNGGVTPAAERAIGHRRQTLVVGLAAPVTGLHMGAAGHMVPLDGTAVVKTLPGASFDTATRQITLPAGTYQMTLTYAAVAPRARANPTWSSYCFDFPHQRLYTTAAHSPGRASHHGGSLTYTVVLSSPTTFSFHLGRGPSGHYTGSINLVEVQLTVRRLGEAPASMSRNSTTT